MTNPEITRSEMIASLVEHSVGVAVADPRQCWLREIFEKGFVGFGKMPERRLLLEMHLRGLLPPDDTFEDDAYGDCLTDPAIN